MKTGEVLVIDLFAGPGGLGEGVCSVSTTRGHKPFKIGISVEKEPSAHKTLTTRALYRKLIEKPNGLRDYLAYLTGKLTRQQLFENHPEEAKLAEAETLGQPMALGENNDIIHSRIRELISQHHGPKIVIGGPPCQAYSLAGRSRNAGIKGYKAEADHRNFLYKEYLKVLSIAQPDIFIMENVRGILSAKVKGEIMFPQILEDLKNPGQVTEMPNAVGYKIYSFVKQAEDSNNPIYTNHSDFLIRSEQFGIPQARHRVILLGVREDIKTIPEVITPFDGVVTVEQVLSDLPALRSGFSKQKDLQKDWENEIRANAKKLSKILAKQFGKKQVEELNLTPRLELNREEQKALCKNNKIPNHLKNWYLVNPPEFVLNHSTRGHMSSDLLRYAYSAAYTQLNNGISPKSRDFPMELAPAHENWTSGSHADRFRTQAATKCATTVTSHISKDGHYFIHYDTSQCRSLTVREAARLQTFPDNYYFEGNRTQQYVQVGNAVPPFLAQQLGYVVMNLLMATRDTSES